MRIFTFTPTTYKDCPIYVRQFSGARGDEFEYSTIIKNELYTFQVSFRLRGWRAIVGFFMAQPFSQEELKNAVEYMEKTAQATIDTVLAPPKKERVDKGNSELSIKQ